jgi:hypothetical protein
MQKQYVILIEGKTDNAVAAAVNVPQRDLDDRIQKLAVDLLVSEIDNYKQLFTEQEPNGCLCIKYRTMYESKGWIYNCKVKKDKLLYRIRSVPITEAKSSGPQL